MGEQTFEIPAFQPQCGRTINLKLAYGCMAMLSMDGATGLASPDHPPARAKRILRSSQRLRVTGALVEIRSIPVAA